MRRFRNLFFAFVVSPEIFIFLLGVLLWYLKVDFISTLGGKVKSDGEIWKFLPTLTLGFSGLVFAYSSKIRAPLENSSNKVLYQWPDYEMLVDRVYVGLAYAVMSSIFALLVWIFGANLSDIFVGSSILIATSVSGITAFTMLLAHQTLRELIERFS